jgi:hypothetical protein
MLVYHAPLEQPMRRAMIVLVQVQVAIQHYAMRMSMFRIIIVYHAQLEQPVQAMIARARILCAMQHYAMRMSM